MVDEIGGARRGVARRCRRFHEVSDVYRFPVQTDAEKSARQGTVTDSLSKVPESPLRLIARNPASTAKLLEKLANYWKRPERVESAVESLRNVEQRQIDFLDPHF